MDLVLLPGLLCDRDLWREQESLFQQNFDRVLHIEYPEEESLAKIGQDAFAQIDRAGIHHFALFGLSMGGIVAFEMFRQNPDRILLLGLLDTNHRADTEEKTAARVSQCDMVRDHRFREVVAEYLKPAMLHPENTERIRERVMQMADRVGPRLFIAHQKALAERPDSTKDLPKISVPTFILCGSEDRLCTPQIHQEIAEVVSLSQYHEILNCGHLSVMEKPKEVNEAIQKFLEDFPPT